MILSEAKSGTERLYGLAIDVDDSGRLIVQDDEGTAHAISVADIEHTCDSLGATSQAWLGLTLESHGKGRIF